MGRAGPFCILLCYENLDLVCTEFLQVWTLPNWLKKKKEKKVEGAVFYLPHEQIWMQDLHNHRLCDENL